MKLKNKIFIGLTKFFLFSFIIFAIINSFFIFKQMARNLSGINVFSIPIFLFTLLILIVIFGFISIFFYMSIYKAERGKNVSASILLLVGTVITIALFVPYK